MSEQYPTIMLAADEGQYAMTAPGVEPQDLEGVELPSPSVLLVVSVGWLTAALRC